MFEQLLPAVEFQVPFDTFERLPRHPASRYEYFGGRAVLTPHPHYAQALLDLTRLAPAPGSQGSLSQDIAIRCLEGHDWACPIASHPGARGRAGAAAVHSRAMSRTRALCCRWSGSMR
jgi:hypothetical protein